MFTTEFKERIEGKINSMDQAISGYNHLADQLETMHHGFVSQDARLATVGAGFFALNGDLHLIDCDVAEAAVTYAEGAELQPVVLASNQRETWTVSSSAGSMQMCFDWVRYLGLAEQQDERVAEEYELELELQQGPRSLVTDTAVHLARRFQLSAQTRSKYERGVTLLGSFLGDVAVSEARATECVPA